MRISYSANEKAQILGFLCALQSYKVSSLKLSLSTYCKPFHKVVY